MSAFVRRAAALWFAVACARSGGAAQESPEAAMPDVKAVLAEAARELAEGRAAEAEDRLRDAIRDQRDPELLLQLAAVLIERAAALDDSSDLSQSLRQGVLEEALETYVEAGKSGGTPARRVDGAIGAATCHSLLNRADAAEAAMRSALAELRASAAPSAERRRLVSEIVHYVTLLGRVDDAQRVIEESGASGELDDGQKKIEELRIAATQLVEARMLPLALEAVAAGGDTFETAFLCWEVAGGTRLEALLNVYSRLLEKRPGDVALLYFRGAARLLLGDGGGAVADLQRCVDDPKVGARARLYLGRALILAGRAEEALPQFERLLASEAPLELVLLPDALNGLIGVAVQRARGRDFQGALALYQRVLTRDPSNLWGRIGEPLCWKSLGEPDKAAAAYEAGLSALPEQPQLLNDYGLLLKSRGERERAKELFERALGASGESIEEQRAAADGGENLGIIAYRDEHDMVAAGRYFARTLLLDPIRPRVRFYRELCLSGMTR